MELGTKTAIAALVISFLSVLGVFINSLITFKTYKNNRRLEFLQRRDHLAQKISDLNAKNAECHLISARFEIVAVKKALLPLRGEEAERMAEVIASLKRTRDGIEASIKLWDKMIQQLHVAYSILTLESDAPAVDRWIADVQAVSDNLKTANDVIYLVCTYSKRTTNC